MISEEKLKEVRKTYIAKKSVYDDDFVDKRLVSLVKDAFFFDSVEKFRKEKSILLLEDVIEFYEAVRRFDSLEEFLKIPEIVKAEDFLVKWNKRVLGEKLPPKGEEFYEKFSEAAKTSLGKKLIRENFKYWVDLVLLYDIQSSFLEMHKGFPFTLEELDEFFWMVSNLNGLHNFDKITKAVTETWVSRNIPVWAVEEEMLEALHYSLDIFIEYNGELPEKEVKEFYEVVREEYE